MLPISKLATTQAEWWQQFSYFWMHQWNYVCNRAPVLLLPCCCIPVVDCFHISRITIFLFHHFLNSCVYWAVVVVYEVISGFFLSVFQSHIRQYTWNYIHGSFPFFASLCLLGQKGLEVCRFFREIFIIWDINIFLQYCFDWLYFRSLNYLTNIFFNVLIYRETHEWKN